MKKLLVIIVSLAVLLILVVWYRVDGTPKNNLAEVPPPPATIDEAFARREAILTEMFADPRTWPKHLEIAAQLLEQSRGEFRTNPLWDLGEINALDRQIIFQFGARQPLTLSSMPEWRGEGEGSSVGEIFTSAAFSWICQRPETAAIWDVHSRVYNRDETTVMLIEIYESDGQLLRKLPVELKPCANRFEVSDG